MRATHVREIRGKVKPGMRAEALRITDEKIFPALMEIAGFVGAESLVHGDHFQFMMHFDDRLFAPHESLPPSHGTLTDAGPSGLAGVGGSIVDANREKPWLSPEFLDDDKYEMWRVQCPLKAEEIDRLLGQLLAQAQDCIEGAQMMTARVMFQRDNPPVPRP